MKRRRELRVAPDRGAPVEAGRPCGLLMPNGTLFIGGTERENPRKMIEAGVVEAILAFLPESSARHRNLRPLWPSDDRNR